MFLDSSKHRSCLDSVDIRQIHIHKNWIRLLGLSQYDRFVTVPGLYGVMSNLCYEQTEDLAGVTVILHNKDFFLHWTFRKL